MANLLQYLNQIAKLVNVPPGKITLKDAVII